MSNAADYVEEVAEKYQLTGDFGHLVKVARTLAKQRDMAIERLREIRQLRTSTHVRRIDGVLQEMDNLELQCDPLYSRALALRIDTF